MTVPTNLTALALDDYDTVLTESLTWGPGHSDRMRAALLKHFAAIEGRKRIRFESGARPT